MNNRTKRPYERKKINRGGALIFGLGLGALFATAAIVIVVAMPLLSTRLESVPMYARSYYNKIFPPPQYLPTPAPTVTFDTTSTDNESPATETEPIPVPLEVASLSVVETDGDVIPAAVNAENEVEGNVDDDVAESAIDVAAVDDLNSQVQVDEPIAPKPQVDLQPLADAFQLTGFNHQWQTWNNCGPATITTHMSYFGRSETQVDAALFLKPNKNDKNVSPHQLAAYAESVGMTAIVRQSGTIEQLKQFLNNGLPILVETWLVHDGDSLGHYRLITGYNDETSQFITSDSLNGPDYVVSYEQFDADWRVFNRLYIILYQPEQADLIANIIGPNLDDQIMYEELVAIAEADIEANPNDQIAYFNKGEALTHLERYEEAAAAFDQARTIGLHWRRLWYQFTPFDAYYATGRYQDVLDLAEATISNSGGLEEAYYYKGLALHTLGQPGAEEALQNALDYNPNFTTAQTALDTWHNNIIEP